MDSDGLSALRESLREAPVVERDGYEYFVHGVTDGVPALSPAILRTIAGGFRDVLERHGVNVGSLDAIVAPEAMAIHHGTALALELEVPLVVVRKRSYGFDDEVAVHQRTSYGDSDLFLNGVGDGDRVVLVDDVLSSGGTIRAVVAALDDAGADLRDALVVLRRVDVDHGDLPLDVSALLDVRVADGRVDVVA